MAETLQCLVFVKKGDMEEEKLTVSPPGRRWNEHSKQDTRRYSHDDDCIYVNLKARHHEPTNEDSAYSAMDDIDMEDIDTHDDNANDIEAFSQLATMEMPGRTYFGGENNNGNGNGNDENTDSDDNADSDDNTDSDEETDGDEENDGDEGNDGEEYIGNLMRTIYSHFHEFSPGLLNWMKRAEYKVPEQDRLPALDGRPVQPDINKPKDFHFRCPLYWLDQARYVTCLAHPLRSIQDVMDHIELHHSEPPYCPICYEVFNNTGSRDSHVKERFCSKLDGEVHGYNKRQLTRMAKRDNIRLPEATRWKQILEIGVKHEQGTLADEMAYLTDGSGLKITKLRDYIFVFLDENSAGGNDIEAYVDVIWNQLNITGWLTEFIQHDQSHLDRVESDAMAISTSLEVWLKRNFVLRPETVSGNGNVGVGNKTSYEFDVEKSRPRYQYLLDMIGSDQKSAFVASLKNWILTTQIPYRIACPFYVHNPDANSDFSKTYLPTSSDFTQPARTAAYLTNVKYTMTLIGIPPDASSPNHWEAIEWIDDS
ncbi:unnamed protein product [Clonostachys rhizophaga]|uniref:Uncharacterized protein n=1 Tax=Clonostachys rhizophaga TaxID=160324 RepID=A0A9N9VI04_9HYPO|nr:unnamed protein product [Clonostachys rhizophaga]